jgi:hypothetical protein
MKNKLINKSRNFFFVLLATFSLVSCNKLQDISPSKIEIVSSKVGSPIGSIVTLPMGANGGNLIVPMANVNLIIPAGAMAAGSVLSAQALSNEIETEGKAVRIIGEFLKPITIEFNYKSSDLNPENNAIAFQLSNGTWVTPKDVIVNKTKNTFAIQLIPKTISLIKKGRPAAGSTYDLASARLFYLKADKASIKIGESVNVKAYAREGIIKTSDLREEYRQEFLKLAVAGEVDYEYVNELPLKFAEFLLNKEIETKAKLEEYEASDLVPLTVVAKEFAFTNKKEGFNRTWGARIGDIKPSGNLGAKYTAPNLESAKGENVKIMFESINTKTKDIAQASTSVFIEDGIERYKGTINIKLVGIYLGGTGILLGESEETWSSELFLKLYKDDKDKTTYKSDINTFKSICSQYYEVYYSSSGKDKDRKTQNGASYGEGEKAGQVIIEIDKKTNTYTIKGWLETVGGNNTRVELIDGNKNTYSTTKYIGNRTIPLYVDIKNLIKPFDAKDKKVFKESIVALWDGNTYNTSWDFKKVE